MKKLYFATPQRSGGFLYEAYEYVFKELGFKWYKYKSYKRAFLYLVLHKYDLIWCESNGKGMVSVLKRELFKDKTKIVTRFHRVPSMMLEERGWKALIPLFGSDAVAWVYDCRKELKSLFPTFKGKFFVVHNGVDLSFYRNLNSIRKEKLIVTVSNWWKHKRLELLIEAKKHLPSYKLFIAGDFLNKEYEAFCRSLIRKTPNVFTLGYANKEEKLRLFNKASIFVLPSKLECWSTHTMEAMACECPVLVTEGGGMNEFVPEEERLPKDITPEQLAERILAMASNKRIGKQNRRQVEKYDWQNVRKEVEVVLNEI